MSIAIGAEFHAIDEANCDDVVSGLSLKNGKELRRERGHKEANVLRVGPEAILLRGDGRLTRCRLYRSGIEERNNYDLLKGR